MRFFSKSNLKTSQGLEIIACTTTDCLACVTLDNWTTDELTASSRSILSLSLCFALGLGDRADPYPRSFALSLSLESETETETERERDREREREREREKKHLVRKSLLLLLS